MHNKIADYSMIKIHFTQCKLARLNHTTLKDWRDCEKVPRVYEGVGTVSSFLRPCEQGRAKCLRCA